MSAAHRSPLVYLIALCALTFALAAPVGPVEAAPNTPDHAETSTYIVVLDQGESQQVAAEHAERHGAQVRHVYRHALRGYAAQMSERAAQRIARDDRVAYVEADELVTVAHHQCGHTGGPPGSAGPACDPGTISGTVTATGTGSGIAGATIVVENTSVSTSTDSDGSYVTDEVDAGTHTVTASAVGYQSTSKSVTVDGDVTGVDFALEPEGDGGGDDPPEEDSDQVAPWGVERVGALEATGTGSGIQVYVIDTGIDQSHADLVANLGDGVAIERCRGGGCVEPWDDDHGHGTHVAGTTGAVDNTIDVVGVAPEVTLHSVKVLAKNGMGSRSGVIAGIDWMKGHVDQEGYGGKAVANMSLGGSGSKSGTCTAGAFAGTDSYHAAICDATNAGIVFAVAAGNSGADAANSVPSAYDDTVITVSATNSSDDWPSWSNWGDEAADWTGVDTAPVAIAAPGVDVLSTRLGGGTTTKSGTSMAAPHVTGGVALYLETSAGSSGYGAFSDAREALLGAAENTGNWSNTSGNPHDESFLTVSAW